MTEVLTIDNYYSDKNLSEFIAPKNSLLKDVKKTNAISYIATEMSKISTDIKYKTDLEYLKIVCRYVENLIFKKDGVLKLDIVVGVFIKLFSITAAEVIILKNQIEFLLNNGRIKKIKVLKKVINFVNKNIKNFF